MRMENGLGTKTSLNMDKKVTLKTHKINMEWFDMKKKIRLKVDLPIDKKHNCKAGNKYYITQRFLVPESDRTSKVEFIAESGEPVCALLGEFDWIVDDD